MKETKLLIKIFVIVIIFVYLIFGLILFFNQKNIVYYPDNQNFETCKGFEDSEKISHKGTRGYYKKNSENLIIFYHGNAGSTCIRDFLKNVFEEMGYSYLFVEYSGYSGDVQKPSKELLMKDVENINEFVVNKKFTKIIIVGESLGTSLATYRATLFEADKLLLISPFNSTLDLAKESYAFYPVSLMIKENYDTGEWIKETKARNIQIIHGANDRIISIKQSKKLFNEIRVVDKKFVEIVGASHNNIYGFRETQSSINNYLSN